MDLIERARIFATAAHAAVGQVAVIDQLKICGGCHVSKLYSDFNQCRTGRFGLHNHCRCCQAIAKRNYYTANREHEITASAAYQKTPKAVTSRRARYVRDKIAILEANRIRRRSPKARSNALCAQRAREEKTPYLKIVRNLRTKVRKVLIGINKSASTLQMLGCSIDELKQHLESRFQPGMTWNNYGYYGWHVDHIRPCSSFDFNDPAAQAQCFHYTNLQPLWRIDNQSKGGVRHEKRRLLDVMPNGNVALMKVARRQIDESPP